jgi:hypothetical protein
LRTSGVVLPCPSLGQLGGGLNGAWLLNPTTMHDDGAADTLTGSIAAFDWFVVGPGSQDTIRNWRTGEIITNAS